MNSKTFHLSSFILFLLFFAFAMPEEAKAENDSCLALWGWEYLPENVANPDSIKVDTCINSPTYNKWYSRKGYYFVPEEYIFSPKPLPMDTSVTYEAIDPEYESTRAGFEALEERFGSFVMRRYYFDDNDTIHLNRKEFLLEFDNYFLIDSVLFYMENIDLVLGAQLDKYPQIVSVESEILEKNNIKIKIYPNPADKEIHIFLKDDLYNISNYLVIYNVYGNKLIEQKIDFGTSEFIINVSSLLNGIYIVTYYNYSTLFIINR